MTAAQVRDLVHRTTDDNWWRGMEAQPDGAAILDAAEAIGAAVSDTLDEQNATGLISTAPTGAPGQCDLHAIRAVPAAAMTIPKGFKFLSNLGVELVVALDVPVALNQAAILLPLRTLRYIDLVNTTEPAFDDVLEAGDALAPIVAAENDATLAAIVAGWIYASSTAISGASMDWLSEHGNERGCRRQPGEEGEAYRARVRAIPDAVTPTAIMEAVTGAATQAKLPTVYMVEPLRDQASDAARMEINLLFADAPFCDGGAFCDDAIGVDLPGKLPFRTCEMPGIREGRGYFRQSVAGDLLEPDGLVLYCDDGFCDDPEWGYPDVGMHPALMAALRGIQEEARQKRAGGVQFDTYVECVKRVDALGEVTADPGGTLAFVAAPPVGFCWMLREGLVTVDSGGSAVDPATDAYMVILILVGGAAVVSDWSSACDGMPLRTFELERIGYFSEQVALIAVLVKSSVSATLRAVGTFWTTPMTL
jgi:hypothetical protein